MLVDVKKHPSAKVVMEKIKEIENIERSISTVTKMLILKSNTPNGISFIQCIFFSCDQASVGPSVCLSVCLSITPFSLCSYHRIHEIFRSYYQ